MRVAICAAVLLLAACSKLGKISDPLPPIVRIPARVDNLSASQNGYNVILSWTNPSKYVDGNPVTDTGAVHVFRNNVEVGTVAAVPAGKPQSYSVDVTNRVGTTMTFAIQLVVPKASKPSPPSNLASIQPIDVPGKPGEIKPTVDQGKIVLEWDPPQRNKELADGYEVQRSDKPTPVRVRNPKLEDSDFEPGKTYTYSVTAFRVADSQILGDGSVKKDVLAKDETRPAAPVGLQIDLLGETALLKWEKNTETDLKGYRVFRSDRPEQPISVGVPNAYPDTGYTAGKGLSYWVVAEDFSGNVSQESEKKPGP